ncbi:ABC transporter permease [Microvirga sp. VF16]|uniref:ABC transporter permease n=1 Tax=Microvirga sp. VF16 TaxID=2807101 RepID=UPI00193CC907|nr:ABC transporter permease [Microvirga sp. VF16]QRM35902.1 ABC transporter permease [Microvirga sp. VF16]
MAADGPPAERRPLRLGRVSPAKTRIVDRGRAISVALKLYVGLIFLFIFAPIAASFVFSFNSDRFPSLPLGHFTTDWYEAVFTDPLVITGFENTLVVGACTSILSTIIGFGAAYTDYRFHFLGKKLYLALALLPPTIPVVILGLGMLAYFARLGIAGELWSVILAHVVMCAPFAMAIIRLRLSQMDQSLEAAAWNLGADEWTALRCVIVPFTMPSILAALFITMAVSFDEFAVAWFVSGLNETLPVRVLGFLQGQVSPRINAIGTVVFLSSITLVVIAQILLRNRARTSDPSGNAH